MMEWLRKFGRWFARIFRWLGEARRVWVALLAVACAFLVSYAMFGTWEARIRIAGLALELLGICTVAVGLGETRKLFGRPTLVDVGLSWFKRFPKFKGQDYVLNAAAGAYSLGGASVSAFATSNPAPGTPLEKRVSILEESINRAQLQIDQAHRKLEEETRSRSTAIDSERRDREAADQKVQKLLEEAAAGGLYLETMGVVWLAIGVLLATASNELARLISNT